MQNGDTHSIVPYQTPNARAIQATGKAALGFLAAFAIVGIPVIVSYLNTQAVSTHNTLLAMVYTLGALFLGVVVTYAVNYTHAIGSNVPPTVNPNVGPNTPASLMSSDLSHTHEVDLHGTDSFQTFHSSGWLPMQQPTAVALPALPMVDSELLVGLVNESLATYLKAKRKVDATPAETPAAETPPLVVEPIPAAKTA